jgi:monoterpene epsilon-lactone hydrolase
LIAVASAMQNVGPSPAPSLVIAPNGTVRVTRIVPVPTTVSPEAQRELTTIKPSPDSHETLEEHRTETEKWQMEMGKKSLKLYSTKLATDTIAGVPVRVVTPLEIAPEKATRVLINLHGGGFRVDSGSLSETIPIPA